MTLRLAVTAAMTIMMLAGCTDSGGDAAETAPSPESSSTTVTLDVGHCWIEPVTFDGARWALPRANQFGLGDRLPRQWEGTGSMERLNENRARYVDAGGAVLIFYAADNPLVNPKRWLCA